MSRERKDKERRSRKREKIKREIDTYFRRRE